MSPDVLFHKYEMYGVIEGQKEAVKKRIQAIPANRLLNGSEDDLIHALVEELKFNVPVLKESEIAVVETREIQMDVRHDPMRMVWDRSSPCYVPGRETIIAVPFDGDTDFFKVRPQTYSLNPPRGTVGTGEIILSYVRTDHNDQVLKQEYEQTVSAIKENLQRLSESAAQFNQQLEGMVASQFKARKERLLADAGMTAALGLPLRKRHEPPATYAVPMKRARPRIEQLKISSEPFKPEPTLAKEDYEEILRIMKSMVQVMEFSPHAFEEMGEEDLRFHLLVPLNAQYEGGATGETFNFQGKTDILIRVDGRNVFIGECKFWKGEKAFLVTIDQLLGYLSWRDTKAAVLIFNRNENFSAVLETISNAAPKHPNCKRSLGRSEETTFRYVFAQPKDPSREIHLAVLAFDIPSAKKNIGTTKTDHAVLRSA